MSAVILRFARHRRSRRQLRQKVISADGALGHLLDFRSNHPRWSGFATSKPVDLRAINPNKPGHGLVGKGVSGHPVSECHDGECVLGTHHCQELCEPGAMDDMPACAQNAQMSTKRQTGLKEIALVDCPLMATHLRAWRKKKKYTQEKIGPLIGFSDHTQLSKIERAEEPYSQRNLEALARIYDCKPWQLLIQDPLDTGWISDFIADLDPETRDKLMKIARNWRTK